MVTIREDWARAADYCSGSILLQLTRKGLAGDSAAARASLAAIEAARARRVDTKVTTITRIIVISHSIGCSMRALGIAEKRFPLDKEKVHWLLQPWIVQAALNRMGNRQLTRDEQREVWNATKAPDKINWPEWWTERG